MPSVIVVGGGVGGLTAAHELAKRGFTVTVYEKLSEWGGKARSANIPRSGQNPIPGEHGFRFFPGFYNHVGCTMKDIPDAASPNGSVYGNLIEATQVGLLQVGKDPFVFSSDAPVGIAGWFKLLVNLFHSQQLGLTRSDATFFAKKLLAYAMSCPSRQEQYYEKVTWWNYLDADNRSAAFQKILAHGLVHSLVAMPPKLASTRTVGTILIQIFEEMATTNGKADRVLNGPTSEVWIKPWITRLVDLGVLLKTGTTLNRITTSGDRIASINVQDASGARDVSADFYVMAIPVEKLRTILTPQQKQLAHITGIDQLKVEWMTGILFYLNRKAPVLFGHSIYADSGWALTSISQGQFWDPARFPLTQYGDGTIKDIVSAIISDWNNATNTQQIHKIAKACTPQELFTEAFAQLAAHRSTVVPPLTGADVIDKSFDLSLSYQNNAWVNDAELLVNTADSLQHRPDPDTWIINMYLASDFVRTTTDLATMEAANEAARLAAKAVCRDAGVPETIETFPLLEPPIFRVFQDWDCANHPTPFNQEYPLAPYLDLLEMGFPLPSF